MGSKFRINWKFLIPLVFAVGIFALLSSMTFSAKQKTVLPPVFDEVRQIVGDGKSKSRRRPDLHLHEQSELGDDLSKYKVEIVRAKDNIARLHVGIVACQDRAPSAMVSLKSFTMFSQKPMQFHVFAEEDLHWQFKYTLSKWPAVKSGQVTYEIRNILYPVKKDTNEWKSMFKPCATQRLFFPEILGDLDSLLYVDTDVLIMRPLEEIWSFFRHFNETQLAGMAPEGEVGSTGWYNRFARHPYYGDLGINSGVMLMNLTRMRQARFIEQIYPLYDTYKSNILWGDQDLLNILFHFHPEMVYLFSCHWNYRADHCMYGNVCRYSEKYGISMLHGSREIFHNEKQPEFKVIYNAFRDFDIRKQTLETLTKNIARGLEAFKTTYCGEVFLKVFRET